MSYIPTKTITRHHDRLTESSDLSKPLSAFVRGDHYLVLTKNMVNYCLSISRILTSTPKLDLTQSIGAGLTSLMTDLFVQRYHNPTIPVLQPSGLYNKRLVVFNPLAYREYSIHFTSIHTPEIIDDVTKLGFLDDLVIKGPYDMQNYLVAINGVFHQTSLYHGDLYVLDGFRTIRLSGRKDIVVVDTTALGGHTVIPLTTGNVLSPNYQSVAVVNTYNSIKDKTLFPVIDGYFYHRDHQVIRAIDDYHLQLYTNKLPLIQQFRHNPRTLYQVDRHGQNAPQTSRKYTDAYESVFLHEKSVPSDRFTTNDFQLSRLTHFHSFIVAINNPSLFTVATELVYSDTPKFYSDFSNEPLSGMMNYKCGLCPSYLIWKDSFEQKSIFLSHHDGDRDYQDLTISPSSIPTLMTDNHLIDLPPSFAQCIDYVSN